MADALVSMLLENLESVLQTGLRLVSGAEDDVEWLHSTFTAVQALLTDAESRQFKDESVRDWLAKLKDAAYDADDILDECRTLQLTEEINAIGNDNKYGDHGIISKVRAAPSQCLLFFAHLSTRYRFASRIREIRERLDRIQDEKAKYQFICCEPKRATSKYEFRRTSSFVEESQVIGRNQDRDFIISKLISESSSEEERISVISIVGIGGLGKTSLAHLVYNDDKVKRHFKKSMWVWVSDDFNVTDLTKKILQDLTGTDIYNNLSELNTLQNKLVEALPEEQFLLVLDDVWNAERTKWEMLMLPFKSSAVHGSKVLVTTRMKKVASEADATHIYHLRGLSDEDSWSLFSRRAFLGREEHECLKFQSNGKRIMNKCKGVPLSLKTVGCVMQRKRTIEDWETVLKSEVWVSLGKGGENILPALLLSYYNLPMHLKQCFAYCAIFPKDSWINKDILIKLWMAQGFIKSEESREMEEIGKDYFDDLLSLSLFQDTRCYGDGEIIACNMHDLVHDLACYVTKSECHIVHNGKPRLNVVKAHHLSVSATRDDESLVLALLCNLKSLRTLLLLLEESSIETIPVDLFHQAKSLRALDLRWSHVKILPSSIGNLKHLRYLNLSHTSIVELPESVGDLCNLQTLSLVGCADLLKLPKGLSKLVSLRHLEIEQTDELNHTPKGIGRLASLRTLSKFVVGDEDGCDIEELGPLNLLTGELQIKNLERVRSKKEANLAKLWKKQSIQALTFLCEQKTEDEWLMIREDEMQRVESVFEGLRPPHTNLRRLEICHHTGCTFPSWIGASLLFSNLVNLELINCRKWRQLPTLGLLPCLKYLTIGGNNEIVQVGHEFIGDGDVVFPKLEKLDFCEMSKWEEWELQERDGVTMMPSLLKLIITSCPMLKSLPALGTLPCLEHLEIHANEALVHVGQELYGVNNGSDYVKGVTFPKLKSLLFISMSEWEEWELRVKGEKIVMPCLLELEVRDCRKLKSLLDNLSAPLLEYLSIDGHGGMSLCSSLPCLPNLKMLYIGNLANLSSLPHNGWEQLELLGELQIYNCPQLRTLPDGLRQLKLLCSVKIHACSLLTTLHDCLGDLKCLHSLKISGCSQLKSLPNAIERFKSLQYLYIHDCPKLTSLPHWLGQLKSLETLCISGYDDLGPLMSLPNGLGDLKSLHSLKINRCAHLKFLPDALGQLKSLHFLSIQECPELRSLPHWLGHLKSLKKLCISGCNELRFLPQELMQLTALQNLSIDNCQHLRESCNKKDDKDWSKIAHIPNIRIR